jgi:hypothetical protein
MVAPVTSSTSTIIADNEQTADINVTSFGTPWTDTDQIVVRSNAAPNGVNEGLRLRRTATTVANEQFAGGTSFTSADLTNTIIYTARRQKSDSQQGEDYADGGYGFFLRDGSGNFRSWRFGGFDDGYDNDLMRVRVVDPEVTGDELEDAGFDVTDVDAVGYFFTCAATSSDASFWILQTYYASDITVTRGDSTTPATFDDLKTELDENAGDYDLVFMERIGASMYRACARYVIGANDANEHYFKQSGFGVEFFQAVNDIWDSGNGERYGAVIQDNSFGITIEVGSDFTLEWDFAALTALNKWYFEVNGNSNTSQTCEFTSVSFTKIGTNDFEAPALFTSCAFSDCDKIVVNDATLSNCIFENPGDGTACIVTTSSDIDGCSFTTATGADYAVEIAAAGTFNWSGVTFTGFTKDLDVTATTGTVTINISGGGDTPTYDTAGATVVINNTVTVQVTVKDADTLAAIENARVFLEADSGGDLPALDSVTITRSGSTASVAHTAHGMANSDEVIIRDADQNEYNGVFTISNVTTNAYDYTISGTPTTPATGTITATALIMNELTNASGVASVSLSYGSDQPITGKARKASSSPYYKSSVVAGSITSSGFTNSTFMIGDE